jgi:hypothetical protein
MPATCRSVGIGVGFARADALDAVVDCGRPGVDALFQFA